MPYLRIESGHGRAVQASTSSPADQGGSPPGPVGRKGENGVLVGIGLPVSRYRDPPPARRLNRTADAHAAKGSEVKLPSHDFPVSPDTSVPQLGSKDMADQARFVQDMRPRGDPKGNRTLHSGYPPADLHDQQQQGTDYDGLD